ncbi:MAG: 50S ribosomal protein L7Ae [Candidatus Diapherotrites archaeon]|nr:50S ribosomal protein L7Ae [Candidatus Diapherotrites archaeon]
MADYIKYKLTPELREKQKQIIQKVKAKKGKIKVGINEVTKAIERGEADLVVIAEDVQPQEIVMHLPVLCEEKNIPYGYIETKKSLGEEAGIKVGASAIAIIKDNEVKKDIEEFAKKIKELKR